jgi:hypothetical protein
MEHPTIHHPPIRINDLILLKEKGSAITCHPSFEVVPVDFVHRNNRFQAYIFMCRFSGTVEGESYTFRKCYARGCPHNLCPHVYQAVIIANRHLARDYGRLKRSGIDIDLKLFSLEEMLVKFADFRDEYGPILTIDDYIYMAKEGNEVCVDLNLEYVPATEHFEYGKNLQTYLMVDLAMTGLGKSHRCQRCLACYPTEKEDEERERQIAVANDRLGQLYMEFDEVSIVYQKQLFN